MFQSGDRVIYGIHGVCRVVDQEERVIDHKHMNYLVLEPEGQEGSSFFVPTGNAAAMGKVKTMLSKEKLEDMLNSPKVQNSGWIFDENQRKQTYRELIGSGDRERLLGMVGALYRHKAAQTAAGRKCHLCDENFLRDAEKLLLSEISIVLEMEPDRAKQYLRKKLCGVN